MEAILDLAARQGYVTTAQARALGAHEHTLTRLVSAGELVKAVRRVYHSVDDRTPEQRHALTTRAMLDADPWSAASHHSALALHGVALYGVRWNQVQVADPRRSSRSHESLHRHVLREGDVVAEIDGLKSLTVPLALCQVAARYGVVAGLVSMDDALRKGLCTPDDLAAIAESGRLRRGIGALRRAIELADGRAESPGESRLRAIVAEGPFSYEVQANVGGPGEGYRVDLLVDGCVALEFDGAQKYDGVDGKLALIAEKRREDWIRDQGLRFMRVISPELNYSVALRRVLHGHVVAARAARAA